MQTPSAWRSRLPLFVVLGVLLVANSALLVSYNLFYDDRFQALVSNEKELLRRLGESRTGLDKVDATEQRITAVQKELEGFFSGTLGSRREKLAPLMEEIYQTTRKVRLRPKGINYTEAEAGGADEIRIGFLVDGTYADVKELLAAFESSPSFLVVEGVSVSLNEDQPDLLHVTLSVVHYFRSEVSRAPRKGRGPVRPGAFAGAGGPPQ